MASRRHICYRVSIIGEERIEESIILKSLEEGFSIRRNSGSSTPIEPQTFDSRGFKTLTVIIGGKKKICSMMLFFLGGGKNIHRGIRLMNIFNSDAVFFSFSLGKMESLKSVKYKFYNEILEFCEKDENVSIPPICLVGHGDVSEDENKRISRSDIFQIGKEIGAIRFIRFSSERDKGLKEILRVVLKT